MSLSLPSRIVLLRLACSQPETKHSAPLLWMRLNSMLIKTSKAC